MLASRASASGALAKFDCPWFIPAVVKYRKLLLEVLGVFFVLQLFARVTPLFFLKVMDKVLVNRVFNTLDVIAADLLLLSLFNIALSVLRAHIHGGFDWERARGAMVNNVVFADYQAALQPAVTFRWK
ncbi:hypothetical protein BI344_17485 [Chromobacterium sphagni]|uniref:ABC transmembrane type-1 domain-containing protein n=1 Tax=Chromobacterium sphagni TaxID=1903179 RepID=A0ABX3CBA5_9NEIS|nr:hypothetical protein [Chromobacterium sphagni]OHX19578.1 hypothetical protein BI344_17485 [Chromobacterium sphagni]